MTNIGPKIIPIIPVGKYYPVSNKPIWAVYDGAGDAVVPTGHPSSSPFYIGVLFGDDCHALPFKARLAKT